MRTNLTFLAATAPLVTTMKPKVKKTVCTFAMGLDIVQNTNKSGSCLRN